MKIDLKNLLSNPDFPKKEKVLLILYGIDKEIAIKDIVKTAVSEGLPEAKNWNISHMLSLSRTQGLTTKLPGGWIITQKGIKTLKEKSLINNTPTQEINSELKEYASQITNNSVKQFVGETILALEHNLLRSSVVLAWVGAMSILYQEVCNKHLDAFNKEASVRFAKWKNATNADGLTQMKEYNFLQVIHAINIVDKNVKGELENCLQLRNSCGHPNSLNIGQNKVAAHIETLILNVYGKYST